MKVSCQTVVIEEKTAQVILYDDDMKLPVGWAWLQVTGPYSVRLLDILVFEQNRRKGYGTALIKQICENVNEVRTQFHPAWMENAGIKLCLKCGFKALSTNNRNVGDLIWKKGQNNGQS